MMKQPAAGAKAEASGTYRMSELVAVSGVSRDMIKYYLRAALLPPAEKPRQNLSLYTDDHLALIGLVQKFQLQTKLALPEIAEVFKTAEYDPNAIELELLSNRYGSGHDPNIIPFGNQARELRALKLPAPFLQQLADAALLPGNQGDQEEIAGLLWAAHRAGVPLDFFAAAQEKLADLSALEVSTLLAIKRPDLSFNDTVEHVTHVNRIINRWMVQEKNRQIRQQFQATIENSERATANLLEAIYRPSDLFRQRHQVEDRLAAALKREPATFDDTYALCTSCLVLGEYQHAIRCAKVAQAKASTREIATACLALAHGLQGDDETAFEFGIQLADSALQHAVVIQARILALLLKAARLRGVADISELMKQAGELFLQGSDHASLDLLEQALLLARANVAFPDFANSRREAIDALESQLLRLDQADDDLPALRIKSLRQPLAAVYRIYAFYYLGQLLQAEGNLTQSRHCFEQVLQLDPASNFGEDAYMQLGKMGQ